MVSDVQKEEIEELEAMITLLKNFNLKRGFSMAFDKENDELWFFKTDHYLECGKFDGVKVKLEELVK